MLAVPGVPDTSPIGTYGVFGGVFMATVIGLDHPEVAPWLSVAIALT